MLQAINDRSKGIVGGIIVFFLSITFASWGIQEYLTGSTEKNAASINGVNITEREYEDAVNKQRQRYQGMFGANMPTDAVFEQNMKKQVLDQLVLQRVMGQTVEANHYRIPDKILAEKIHAMEPFLVAGKFTAAAYQQALNNSGMTRVEFEQLYRRDLMAKQLEEGISKSVALPGNIAQRYEQLQHQSRNIQYIVFNNNKTLPDFAVTDEEIQIYFTKNQDRYKTPEQVSISYVEFTADKIEAIAKVDDEQLRHQYNEYVATLASRGERKARHILVKTDATASAELKDEAKKKATDLASQLKSGKNFAELAKQFSDDTLSAKQGGDLGWISKGMMDGAFEQALFALPKKGDVSDVIESSFGYHIIQLDDVKAEQPVAFEVKKAELLNTMRQQEIDSLFYDKSEHLATLAYENDQSLQPAADALGLKIQSTGLFTRSGGAGIAGNEAVRKVVFSDVVLKDARNSEVLELGKNHIVVLRVNEHRPVKLMTLEEVKPYVTLAVKAEKAHQKNMATSLQALADATAGKSLEAIAKEHQGELIKLGDIQRSHSGADSRVVQAAFSMTRPTPPQATYDTVETQSGMALVAVLSVTSSTADTRPEELQAAASLLEGDIAEQEMMAMLNYLKAESDIVMAKDLLQGD